MRRCLLTSRQAKQPAINSTAHAAPVRIIQIQLHAQVAKQCSLFRSRGIERPCESTGDKI